MRVKPVNRINIDGAMDRIVSAAMITTEVEGLCRPPRLMLTDGLAAGDKRTGHLAARVESGSAVESGWLSRERSGKDTPRFGSAPDSQLPQLGDGGVPCHRRLPRLRPPWRVDLQFGRGGLQLGRRGPR